MRGRPRLEKAVVSVATVAAMLILVTTVVRGVPPSVYGFCRPTTAVAENGTVYRTCEIGLSWPYDLYSVKEVASTDYEGVHFILYGYDTHVAPVVNVTGQEPSGLTQSIFVTTWCGWGCNRTNFTVLSPDRAFGTTWDGGSMISLLVRSV